METRMAPQSKQKVYDEIMVYITQLKTDVSVQIEALKPHLATEKNNENKAQMKALINVLGDLEPLLQDATSIQIKSMEKELPAFIDTLITKRKQIAETNLDSLRNHPLYTQFHDAKYKIIDQIMNLEEEIPPLLEPYYDWSAFQKGHGQSPVDLTQEPLPDSKMFLTRDFTRALDIIKINGKPLSEYSKDYNFEQIDEITRFFKEVLLKNVTADERELDAMVTYLGKNLCQSGLLYPVSSSLQNAMMAPDKQHKPYNDPADVKRQVNIITTERGIKIQEYMRVNTIRINDGRDGTSNPLTTLANDRGELKAEVPGEPIIKAEGIVDIDFIANPEKPTLRAESNNINYGHAALRQEMAYRSPLKILYDYLVSLIFGTNIEVKPLQQAKMKANLQGGRTQNNSDDPDTQPLF